MLEIMQAVNNYIIIDPIKEEVKEEEGLLIMDQHVDDIRYLKASVISIGNLTEGIKVGDTIYYDRRSGHGIEYDDNLYQVIKQQDVVLVG
jgi:co-chaperonin GroES (HSP10)